MTAAKKWVSHCHGLPIGLWRWEVGIWSLFLTFILWNVLLCYYWGQWWPLDDTFLFIYNIFLHKSKEYRKREERKGKWLMRFTTHRALSLQWLLVGGQIDPGNKGSFPPPVYLFTAHSHQSETDKGWPSATLWELMQAGLSHSVTITRLCVYVCRVFKQQWPWWTDDLLNFEVNKPVYCLLFFLWQYTGSLLITGSLRKNLNSNFLVGFTGISVFVCIHGGFILTARVL